MNKKFVNPRAFPVPSFFNVEFSGQIRQCLESSLDISNRMGSKKGILVYNGISRKLIPLAVALYMLCLPWITVIFLFAIAPIFGANKLTFT